jgi:hypothetical protein
VPWSLLQVSAGRDSPLNRVEWRRHELYPVRGFTIQTLRLALGLSSTTSPKGDRNKGRRNYGVFEDSTAFVNSRSIRRDLSKGQQAMRVALLYPDPEKGGRGHKGRAAETADFNQRRLRQARQVLAYSRDMALAARDGTLRLDEALETVKAPAEAAGWPSRLEAEWTAANGQKPPARALRLTAATFSSCSSFGSAASFLAASMYFFDCDFP